MVKKAFWNVYPLIIFVIILLLFFSTPTIIHNRLQENLNIYFQVDTASFCSLIRRKLAALGLLWPIAEKMSLCFQLYLFATGLPSTIVDNSSCFLFCEFPLAVAAAKNNPIPAKTTHLLIMYATYRM